MEYKRNHYVPRWLLNNFMNESGELFYHSKEKPDASVIHRNPDSIFNAPNLYAAYDNDGVRDILLESDKYKQLDNLAKEVADKIINTIRAGKQISLSAEDRTICLIFLYNQIKRTPDFMNEMMSNDKVEIAFIAAFEKLFDVVEEPTKGALKTKLSELIDPKMKDQIIQTGKIEALKRDSEEAIDVLRQRGIGFIGPESPSKSFIIGSRPVLRLSHLDRKSLTDPTVELILPLAYDVAMVSVGQYDVTSYVRCPQGETRRLNNLTAKQSTEIAGRSRELVISLKNSR